MFTLLEYRYRKYLLEKEELKMEYICQCCAMPMQEGSDLFSTNADGSINKDYCKYCYENGNFTCDCSMQDMIDFCVPMMVKEGMDEAESREYMNETLPTLKRWAK